MNTVVPAAASASAACRTGEVASGPVAARVLVSSRSAKNNETPNAMMMIASVVAVGTSRSEAGPLTSTTRVPGRSRTEPSGREPFDPPASVL